MSEPSFIVSSYDRLYFFEGEKKIIDKPMRYPFGITWSKDDVFISERGRYQITKLNSDFNTSGVFEIGAKNKDIHQLLYLDDKIYCTSTGESKLEYVDNKFNQNWTLLSFDKATYMNAIFYDQKTKNIWLCLNNNRNQKESYFVCLDENLNKIAQTSGVAFDCHNIYVEGNNLYTLSSSSSKLVVFDIKKDKIICEKNIVCEKYSHLTWLRGMSKTNSNFYVGLCATAALKRNRSGTESLICKLNKDYEIEDTYLLCGVNSIQDFRITNKRDYAHHNIKFPYRDVQ